MKEQVQPGQIYIVAGMGYLLAADTPPAYLKNEILIFLDHGNYNYHAGIDEIVRQTSVEDVVRYEEQKRYRNLTCREDDCWCRKHPTTKAAYERVFRQAKASKVLER